MVLVKHCNRNKKNESADSEILEMKYKRKGGNNYAGL
jgi:hypothetical protein